MRFAGSSAVAAEKKAEPVRANADDSILTVDFGALVVVCLFQCVQMCLSFATVAKQIGALPRGATVKCIGATWFVACLYFSVFRTQRRLGASRAGLESWSTSDARGSLCSRVLRLSSCVLQPEIKGQGDGHCAANSKNYVQIP